MFFIHSEKRSEKINVLHNTKLCKIDPKFHIQNVLGWVYKHSERKFFATSFIFFCDWIQLLRDVWLALICKTGAKWIYVSVNIWRCIGSTYSFKFVTARATWAFRRITLIGNRKQSCPIPKSHQWLFDPIY